MMTLGAVAQPEIKLVDQEDRQTSVDRQTEY